jgi:hypothetical protein
MSKVQMMLALDPSCLTAPTQVDLDKIKAAMLWPNDEDRRHRALKAAYAQHLIDANGLPDPKTMNAEELRELVVLMRSAGTIEAFADSIVLAFRRGVSAGYALCEAVGLSLLSPETPVSLRPIKEKFSASVSGETSRKPATMQADWDEYRSVASLWAAYVHRIDGNGKEPWPCALTEIGEFLSIAECFRRQAEAVRPKQANRPLLTPGESVLLPASINLPVTNLEFRRAG